MPAFGGGAHPSVWSGIGQDARHRWHLAFDAQLGPRHPKQNPSSSRRPRPFLMRSDRIECGVRGAQKFLFGGLCVANCGRRLEECNGSVCGSDDLRSPAPSSASRRAVRAATQTICSTVSVRQITMIARTALETSPDKRLRWARSFGSRHQLDSTQGSISGVAGAPTKSLDVLAASCKRKHALGAPAKTFGQSSFVEGVGGKGACST